MPGPIFNFIYHRLNQACILAFWSKGKETEEVANLVAVSRIPLASLFAVAEDAIRTASPEEFGKFLSLIRTTAKNLGLLLMQSPTREQIAEYCTKLQDHIRMECPHVDADSLDMGELAAHISSTMERMRIERPITTSIEAALLPIGDSENRRMAEAYNLYATGKPFGVLMRGLRKTFRKEYSFWAWTQVSSGYRYEEQRCPYVLPDPEILGIQTNVSDHHADELRPSGERIPPANFCKPAITVPEDTRCSICVADVIVDPEGSSDATPAEELPVITACGHFFHLFCLELWINDSAMRTANLCPECRTEMCEARPRLPASLMMEDEEALADANDRYAMDIRLE